MVGVIPFCNGSTDNDEVSDDTEMVRNLIKEQKTEQGGKQDL